jgi:predicted CXXCH cytochrome family protein
MPKVRSKSKKTQAKKSISPRTLQIIRIVLAVIGVGILLTASGFTFAATQETHDSFCASCHTRPESDFYQRSLDAQAVDLASFHKEKNTRCIDCHSGVGVSGRVSAELLGAHNALAYYSGMAVQPAVLTRHIGDDSCLKCHEDIAARQDMNNHFHVFLARWQALDPNAGTCVSCHSGHATDGNSQIQFLNEANTQAVCESCHRAVGGGE